MQHLAQLNIGKLLQPIDHPQIADFVENLDRINHLAEQSKGFVWRLKDDSGNATSIQEFSDPLVILNLSVWESVEDLKSFVYRTDHLNFYLRRSEWFQPHQAPHMALWWIPAGHIPTVAEAKERLDYLQKNGESEYAFTFRKILQP
ncbi:MAG: DUF3291 domain-containing protein [Saprospiraceae bacterium]